jgi:putative DNA primase/helicase
MVLGECAQVRLGGVQERLGVAEGIETAISVGKLFGIPCWAAISANGMKAWDPPPQVRTVVICSDNDANFTGQEAAYTLARRLSLKGLEVEVHIPPQVGTDWNDVFKLESHMGAA